MIDKNKYSKTAEDFEKWLNKQYILWNVNPKGEIYYEHDTGGCLYLEDEMQASVYLKYFDECGIYIDIDSESICENSDHWTFTIDQNEFGHDGNDKTYNSRLSAFKSAIQNASIIREKQL